MNMIVPQTRLLFWVAMVVLPFAALGALHADAAPFAVVAIAALAVLVLLDVVLGYGSLHGIQVELPEVVRMSRDREGRFELKVKNERQTAKRLRLGLLFPAEIQPAMEEVQVALPAGDEWSQLSWPCTPRKRGNYRLREVFLETASPLGFWAVRGTMPVDSEIRVYPNLLKERKNLAALFLNRGAFGIHAQRQVGKGRDFEKLREYIPGDSFDDIHWKATAKRGHPVTKIFQIERTQEVYVILDASRLSAREPAARVADSPPHSFAPGTEVLRDIRDAEAGSSVLERFITSALVLGLAAEKQGDLFGLLTFSDRVERFVRAKNGQAHYGACRDALYTLQPREVTPDFDEVATFIRLRLRRRALLIFLTALDDPVLAESFVRNLDLVCHQHLVLVNMLKPAGTDPLFTQPDAATIDDLYRHLGGHLQWHKLRELEKVLQRRGVRFSLVENEKLSVQLVSQYLGVKQRQLL